MKFMVADKAQGRALSRFAARITMPGTIELAYLREPDYFTGLAAQGDAGQVLTALDDDGEVVATGCRCERPVYVNGRSADVGYLSGLRLLPEYRNGTLLARGYARMRELHRQGTVPGYLTTVVDGNKRARRVLESGKGGLPVYHDLGEYHSYAVLMKRNPVPPDIPSGMETYAGDAIGMERIVSFLNTHGPRRQFYPRYGSAAFDGTVLPGLQASDFVAVYRNGTPAGVIAGWDQSRYKQLEVRGYRGVLRVLRPVINGGLRVMGYHPLPGRSGTVNLFYAGFICVADDDPQVLAYLIDSLLYARRAGGYHLCTVGFHHDDPLRQCMQRYRTVVYKSRLYMVAWDDGREFAANLDITRVPYLEPAML